VIDELVRAAAQLDPTSSAAVPCPFDPTPRPPPAAAAPEAPAAAVEGKPLHDASMELPAAAARVISDCHFAVQLNHFIFSSCFSNVTIGFSRGAAENGAAVAERPAVEGPPTLAPIPLKPTEHSGFVYRCTAKKAAVRLWPAYGPPHPSNTMHLDLSGSNIFEPSGIFSRNLCSGAR
jgi:hypothetical protein